MVYHRYPNGIRSIDKNSIDKNSKKVSNKKGEKTFEEILTEKNIQGELKDTFFDFIKMRKIIKKPLTNKGLELLISRLNRLTKDEEEKIAILNQSIERSWQTVYELKEKIVKKEKQEGEYKIVDTQAISQEEYRKKLEELGGQNGR